MKKIIITSIFALFGAVLFAQTVPIQDQAKPASTQCTAQTKAGSQCKNHTTSTDGRCWVHGGKPAAKPAQAARTQCSATTKAGNRCKNRTTSLDGRCHIHSK